MMCLKMFLLCILTLFHYNKVANSFLMGKTASQFFAYGDRNADGQIDTDDLSRIYNMAWVFEWTMLSKKMSDEVTNDGVITDKEFFEHLRGDHKGME